MTLPTYPLLLSRENWPGFTLHSVQKDFEWPSRTSLSSTSHLRTNPFETWAMPANASISWNMTWAEACQDMASCGLPHMLDLLRVNTLETWMSGNLNPTTTRCNKACHRWWMRKESAAHHPWTRCLSRWLIQPTYCNKTCSSTWISVDPVPNRFQKCNFQGYLSPLQFKCHFRAFSSFFFGSSIRWSHVKKSFPIEHWIISRIWVDITKKWWNNPYWHDITYLKTSATLPPLFLSFHALLGRSTP